MKRKERTHTDDEFTKIVQESFSIAQVLTKLGLRPCGGNFKCFHSKVAQLNLDTKHFTGKGHLKGKNHDWSVVLPLVDILKTDSGYQSYKLKQRLFKENFKQKQCEECKNTEWLNKPIPLELDHINGINTDNRLENLRILCPNCHAQTDTYRGKNKGKRI